MIDNPGIQPNPNPQALNKYQAQNTHTEHHRGQLVTTEDFNLTTDKVTLSYSAKSVLTYDNSMTLQGVQNDGFDLIRGLVLNIFKEQGIELKIQVGDTEINLEDITQEEATELIADDGYFGVEQTSSRIADLAIAIVGGDPTRIDAIKEGVEQGFNEALEAFGGWLPDISYKTYDAVMEKLDAWANENSVSQAA